MKRFTALLLVLLLMVGLVLPANAVAIPEGQEVTATLLSSTGEGLADAKVSYCISSWADAGVTDSEGRITFVVPQGTKTLTVRMAYGGARLDLKQDASQDSTFDFTTQDVAVKLVDSAGNGLQGGAVRYCWSSWADFGATNETGEAHRELLPGTYTFRMTYEGARIDIKQDITVNPVVVFRTQDTIVRLMDSQGTGLTDGKVRYCWSSWADYGMTGSEGEAHKELLPGTYTFRMDYHGAWLDLKQDTAVNPVVTFNTLKSVVKVTNGEGVPVPNTKIRYSWASWFDYGFTGENGEASRELLPSTYTFRAYLASAYQDLKQNISAEPVFLFQGSPAPAQYALSTAVQPADSGAVTLSPNKTVYTSGDTVTLTPVAATGFAFKGWSGANGTEVSDSKLVMTGNKSVTAVFEAVPVAAFNLSLESEPAAGGSVAASPQKTSYAAGETVTLTPVPASGFVFKGWSGAHGAQVQENTLKMDSSKQVTAVFESVAANVIIIRNVQELMATEQSTKVGGITVLIEDGDYVLPKGLWLTGSNLTYKSRSGNRDGVVLRGDFKTSHIFWITSDNVTLQDLSIGQVNNHGVQVHSEKDADNAVIRNIRFFDIKEQMIKGSGSTAEIYSNDCLVEDCLFEFTAGKAYQYYTGGIDVHKGDGWIVRNNTFRNIISPVSSLTEGAIHFWSASRDTLIENNIITNCDRGIMLGLDTVYHYNGNVRNNTIQTVRDVGIYLANAQGAKVYNNTVYISSAYPNAIEYRFAGTKDAEIVNNLTNKAITRRDNGTATVSNNVTSSAASWFKSVPSGDLHLNAPIAAVIDKGRDLSAVPQDMDGDLRNPGRSDIGADELKGAVLPQAVALTLVADKDACIANNQDGITFSVTGVFSDGTTGPVTPDAFACVDASGKSVPMTGSTFKTLKAGSYTVTAVSAAVNSNGVTVTAKPEDLLNLQASGVQLRHTQGQTFITWNEINRIIPTETVSMKELHALKNAYPRKISYQIYRSNSPIVSLNGLSPIATVAPLSGWNFDFYGSGSSQTDKPSFRYVIQNNSPLPNGTGVWVNNPQQEGPAYYAVTVKVDGVENPLLSADNAPGAAVTETVGQGEPVLQRIEKPDSFQYIKGATLYYYTRWEAPPNCSMAGKPMDYLVAVPSKKLAAAPVGIHMHCWGGNLEGGYGWWNDAEDGAIMLASNELPYDWWTGYQEKILTASPPTTQVAWESGVVRPYTTNRLFSFLDWMETQPQWTIDPSRTFTAGSSMGGSGSIMTALRNSDRIAWSRSWVGVHVPSDSPTYMSSYANVFGKSTYNVLYENGVKVWDYFNDDWYLRNHPAEEIGFITFSNGKNDAGIGWNQAVTFYKALQDTKRPHLFIWGQQGHSQRTIMPLNGSERVMPIDIRLDQSLPAFTRCSLDNLPGNGSPTDGDPAGQINAYLYWETGDIIDTSNQWAMTVALTGSAPQGSCKVDVTPRRLQQLKVAPGQTLHWTNRDVATGTVLESGTVQADANGLITLEQITVGKGKNRLVIVKE